MQPPRISHHQASPPEPQTMRTFPMAENDTQDAPQTQATPAAKPAAPARKTGLSPAQQKLQAALEKAAHAKAGNKAHNASTAGFKGKSTFAGKKTAFQR